MTNATTFPLYIKVAGRLYGVTGIFTTVDETNAWLAENPGHGVIAEEAGHTLTALNLDRGWAPGIDLAAYAKHLAMLNEALAYKAEQFDGPADVDLDVSGADLVDWFADWRGRAKASLAKYG